jgi:hypothetical protein
VPASLLKGALLTNEDLISNCRLAADAYLFDQSRSLLIARIDTTISQSGWIANCCNRILQKTLLVAVSIIESKYLAQTPAQETRQPQSGLNFPILLADQPKNGIYVTYKDFLNNDPSPAPFTAEAKTRARVVHSPRMPDSVIATCWGYCDETGVYMNINKDFYKLNRIQNTFDVLGPASVEIRNLSLTRAINFTSSFLIDNPYKFIDIEPFFEPLIKKIDYLKYYQLDIRTGLLK